MNFCHRCSTKLQQTAVHSYSCEQGHAIYDNPSPTAALFLINPEGKLLLSVRGGEPHKGMLDAFGGFVDGEETLEQSITRELREELGLEPSEYDEPKFLTSGVGHYPFGGETKVLLSSIFWARLLTDRQLTPTDDVADIRVMEINEVNMDEIHDDDIRVGIRKLQQLFSS